MLNRNRIIDLGVLDKALDVRQWCDFCVDRDLKHYKAYENYCSACWRYIFDN